MTTPSPSSAVSEKSTRGGLWTYATAVGLGLLLAATYLPLLVLQAQGLWDRPHYQFLPFVLLGSAYLAWRDTRNPGPLEPGSPWDSAWLMGGTWAILALAVLFLSPWLGSVAALVAVPVVAHAWGGPRLVRRLLPAWGLLWITLPLPGALDQQLILWLQTVASQWSSVVLDVLGVVHLLSGNVIEIPEKSLFIEETCSGVHSLFVVLAGTLFLALAVRCSWMRGVALILTAIGWVLLGNVVRIVTVVWAQTQWKVDLLSGTSHEVLGFVMTALILVLVASTAGLYRGLGAFLSHEWHDLAARWRQWRASRPDPAYDPTRDVVVPPAPISVVPAPRTARIAPAGPDRIRFPALSRTPLLRWPVLAAFAAMAIVQVPSIWPCIATGFTERHALSSHLRSILDAETLPPKWGPFVRQGFETQGRSRSDSLGEFSRSWSYRLGTTPVVASVDFPFRGWHELTNCYQGAGWTLQRWTAGHGAHGPFVAADFTMPPDRCGYLVFRLLDARGRPIRPPDQPEPTDNSVSYFLERLAVWRKSSWQHLQNRYVPGFTAQVQVFVESPRPLTEAEREQIRAFLEFISARIHSAGLGVQGPTS